MQWDCCKRSDFFPPGWSGEWRGSKGFWNLRGRPHLMGRARTLRGTLMPSLSHLLYPGSHLAYPFQCLKHLANQLFPSAATLVRGLVISQQMSEARPWLILSPPSPLPSVHPPHCWWNGLAANGSHHSGVWNPPMTHHVYIRPSLIWLLFPLKAQLLFLSLHIMFQ